MTTSDDPGALKPEIFEILLALQEGPVHGFGLVEAVRTNTGDRVTLAPSLLYRRLHRLEASGLIEDAGEASGLRGKPRRLYRLTSRGRTVLREEAARVVALADSDRLRRVLDTRPDRAT